LSPAIGKLKTQQVSFFMGDLNESEKKFYFKDVKDLKAEVDKFTEKSLNQKQRKIIQQYSKRNKFAVKSMNAGLIGTGLEDELSLTKKQRENLLSLRTETQEKWKSLSDSANLRIAKLNLESLEKIIEQLDEDQKNKIGNKIEQVIDEYKRRIEKLDKGKNRKN